MDFSLSCTCLVLSGKTGSGKSLLLQQLESLGYPIVNLEKIASHRGSVFGNLLLPPQPSQTNFETELQETCLHFAESKYILIEQKPSSIGKRKIPIWLYSKMSDGILIELNADKSIRISNLLNSYKPAGRANLMNAMHKLAGRLPATMIGELEGYLNDDRYDMFIEKMLDYYDATDRYRLPKKTTITLEITSNDFSKVARELLERLSQHEINFNHLINA